MARKRKQRGDDHGGTAGAGHGGGGTGRWLVSYSDFVTLMFVVFVVLFAMAKVDSTKYAGLARSLNASLGAAVPNAGIPPMPVQTQSGIPIPITPNRNGSTPGPGGPTDGETPPDALAPVISPPTVEELKPGPNPQPKPNPQPPASNNGPSPTPPPPKAADPLEGLKDAFQGLPGARTGLLAVALQERGLVISIAGSVLFEPGSTTLRPDAQPILRSISAQLAGVTTPIMVEGTGDPTPPANFSQWDLASLRAGAVVKFFVDSGQSGERFVVIGYGGNTSTGAGPNQRVTIVVMRTAQS